MAQRQHLLRACRFLCAPGCERDLESNAPPLASAVLVGELEVNALINARPRGLSRGGERAGKTAVSVWSEIRSEAKRHTSWKVEGVDHRRGSAGKGRGSRVVLRRSPD
jgi:hypothetical protein